MQPIDVLTQAKALIATPETWTQGYVARTASGEPCNEDHPDAVCWCAAGAVQRIGNHDETRVVLWGSIGILEQVAGEMFPELIDWDAEDAPIGQLNDKVNHEQIMQLFDEAIRRSEHVAL